MKNPTEGLQLTLIQTKSQARELAALLRSYEVIAMDFETNAIPIQHPNFKAVGVSFAVDGIRGWYIPFGHKMPRQPGLFAPALKQLDQQFVFDTFRFVWKERKVVAHNIKVEAQILNAYGEDVRHWKDPNGRGGGLYFCTFGAMRVLDDRERNNSLKVLTKKFFNREPLKLKDVTEDDNFDFTHVPLDIALDYAGPDSTNCYRLYEYQIQKLQENTERGRGSLNVFFEHEMPLLDSVCRIEMVGMRLDEERLKDIHEQTTERCNEIEKLIKQHLYYRCEDFDEQFGAFACSKQNTVRAMLFDVFNLPYPKNTGEDEPKVDKEALESILEHRKVVDNPQFTMAVEVLTLLLEFRKVDKIRSTYTTNLLEKLIDGVLYPALNQFKVKSGRFSSQDPNGQNLPSGRDPDDHFKIRRAFLPHVRGWKFVIADYSALEMRIAAAVSGCKVLKAIILGEITIFDTDKLKCRVNDPQEVYATQLAKALKDSVPEDRAKQEAGFVDIHKYTAAISFNVAYDEVTKLQRENAKRVNFGILYGISQFGLAVQLKIKVKEAELLIQGYMEAYPGVASWIEQSKARVFRNHRIATVQGRFRQVPEYFLDKPYEKWNSVFRWAVNHIIQGTGGILTKDAMRRVDIALATAGLKARQAFQIHDEIIVACPPEEAELVGRLLTEAMNTELFGVPIFTDGFLVLDNLQK